MKKLFAVLLITAVLLCGCRQSNLPARVYLDSVMSNYGQLPAGRFYGAGDGNEVFSQYMAFSLYGDESSVGNILPSDDGGSSLFPEEFTLVDDFCIWLCSDMSAPCEFAVFRTRAASDTTVIAKMLFRRLERLKTFWRETPYSESVDNAKVSIEGNYVVFELFGSTSSNKQ